MKQKSNLDTIKNFKVGFCASSGFFGFFHHAGVLKALLENKIYPVSMTGSSAGALVTAMYAAGMDIDKIEKELFSLRKSDFVDFKFPVFNERFGLIAGYKFKSTLSRILPVHGFFNCKIPLTLNTYDLKSGTVKYLSSGSLISAVYASCAVPYMFAPAEMDGQLYCDGGIVDKVPLIPFNNSKDVEAVIISWLPDSLHKKNKIFSYVRKALSKVPAEERCERAKVSVRILRDNNKKIFVIMPEPVPLGPLTLKKGKEAFLNAYDKTKKILFSSNPDLLNPCEPWNK